MRKRLLKYNTISSFLLQIVTIICGFIVPQLILSKYGSETNGLVNSINYYLNFLSLLELGIGSIVQSALYKPLAERDYDLVSKIIISGNSFFKKIAYALACYIVVLIFTYPHFINTEFDFQYTAALIIAIGISFFSQFYFGVIERILLTADQKGYIQYICQILTLVLNTIACVVLIELNASIQIVKLVSSLIFLIRPIILRLYVRKKYKLNRKLKNFSEPLTQKWNGIAQNVAYVVLENTDVIVLSSLSTLTNVSIYSVYHLVIYGVKQLVFAMIAGLQSLFGNLWANNEIETLRLLFKRIEWVIHTVVIILFGATSTLIVPFVSIYTRGISDADYIVPVFALLLTIANAMHCLRLPYQIMISACNHYKQTQICHIIAAIINIVISVVTVYRFGLVGVAIGTLVAMLYQTIWMAFYNSRSLICWSIIIFFKHMSVDVIVFSIGYFVTKYFTPQVCDSYIQWALIGVGNVIAWLVISFVVNRLVYKEEIQYYINLLVDKIARRQEL